MNESLLLDIKNTLDQLTGKGIKPSSREQEIGDQTEAILNRKKIRRILKSKH